MKKIFLGLIAIALVSGTALAANDGGGKKKARKKAKTECKIQNCDPKNCDPKNCDPKQCDPKKCGPKAEVKDCSSTCTGS